jgi:hypothetical protein
MSAYDYMSWFSQHICLPLLSRSSINAQIHNNNNNIHHHHHVVVNLRFTNQLILDPNLTDWLTDDDDLTYYMRLINSYVCAHCFLASLPLCMSGHWSSFIHSFIDCLYVYVRSMIMFDPIYIFVWSCKDNAKWPIDV